MKKFIARIVYQKNRLKNKPDWSLMLTPSARYARLWFWAFALAVGGVIIKLLC